MKQKLAPHQQQAVTAIIKAAKNHSRAMVTKACGTGKTLIAIKYTEKSKSKNIIVFLPSLGLVKQTLEYWLEQSKWDVDNYLCVCSDKTVGKRNYDEIEVSEDELACDVTTNPDEVKAFLRKRNARKANIIFCTYQSADVVASGLTKSFRFDLGIFDEAHKTSGPLNKHFALALDDKNIKINFRLFMTATPRHFKLRKKGSDEQELSCSMDDEDVYGLVAYNLPFSQAVEQNIICDYKVIVSVITSKDLTRINFKQSKIKVKGGSLPVEKVAHRLALKNAAQKYRVKKWITFHPRVKEADEFAHKRKTKGYDTLLDGFQIRHINQQFSVSFRTLCL